MGEVLGDKETKLAKVKDLIKKLHEKIISMEEAKQIFNDLTKGMQPHEIAIIEEQLVKEGMPLEEVHSLCDVHLELFKQTLEEEQATVPEGHPIQILMAEHTKVIEFAFELRKLMKDLPKDTEHIPENIKVKLDNIVKHFKEAEKHYLREENVLFPMLEKRGIVQPPQIMWMEHDTIRDLKKKLYQRIDDLKTKLSRELLSELKTLTHQFAEFLSNHFYKENRVLFPTALKVIKEHEWKSLREQFDEIGYCCFTPLKEFTPQEVPEGKAKGGTSDTIKFSSGELSHKELEAMLDALPVDITFVDKNDVVRYFNQAEDRIFVRSKAIIGRTVQNCHPKKSVHIVNKIVEDLKSGRRDVADFWINLQGKLVYIRYFAVRSPDGEYLGTLEVSQDITKIKQLEGEKRLLDD